MKTEQRFMTVRELVELAKNGMATANEEYQRGPVWRPHQQKKLIDSVMRRYQLPIFYLHYKKTEAGGLTRESYDIIDGQQRITALHSFVEGAFPLFAADDPQARFPNFLRDEPCDWGAKKYQEFSEELQERLLSTQLPIAYIETDDDNEVRDLFVRLQSGSPLNAQEKRDTYPGRFTEFILQLGGKPAILRYPGHNFFQRVLRMKPGSDRGKTRQLAAQIVILFLGRRTVGRFTDINASAIDDYYYTNLDFDSDSPNCKRLVAILDKLNDLLGSGSMQPLRGHDAMHLVLFLDQIWDDYTRSWESTLRDAQRSFSATVARAAKSSKDGNPDEAWLNYGVWTRSNSDRGENIRLRHVYYSRRMFELLGKVTPLDPHRAFNALEREIIYAREGSKCQKPDCGAIVPWNEAEIHHVKPHSEGGRTEIKNGALVHKHCHPLSDDDVKAFAEGYSSA